MTPTTPTTQPQPPAPEPIETPSTTPSTLNEPRGFMPGQPGMGGKLDMDAWKRDELPDWLSEERASLRMPDSEPQSPSTTPSTSSGVWGYAPADGGTEGKLDMEALRRNEWNEWLAFERDCFLAAGSEPSQKPEPPETEEG